jgi:DNA modification methylase
MSQQTCNSAVELDVLAQGMAKQHENYQDALQELVDNSVSSVIPGEQYFKNPNKSIKIVITLIRDAETVKTIIADDGPGISKSDLQNQIFRTGNKQVSDGILNNVGWGLKASLAWFEQTIRSGDIDPRDPWFKLVTQTTANDSIWCVDGPVTGDLPITEGTSNDWGVGTESGEISLANDSHGTRIHASCNRARFDTDVWASADSLATKAQALRERFGVLFRRLLTAHENNEIWIRYHDLEANNRGDLEVLPIKPIYQSDDAEDDADSQTEWGSEYGYDEFEIATPDGTYNIEFERGMLDFEAMGEAVTERADGLLTTGGNFRTRYRPSQARQGIDIYANGRLLMTSVFTDLFDLARNPQYNYFGGTLRIIPEDPKNTEVPTDNKKTRIDTNSELWQKLQEKLSTDTFQPQGKRYDRDSSSEDRDAETDEHGDRDDRPVADLEGTADPDGESPIDGERFGLHPRDSRHLKSHLQYFGEDRLDGDLVDLTITSPPYADMKDYGYDPDAQIGIGDSYEDYLDDLRRVFQQVYDITRDHGSLWVVVNTFSQDGNMFELPSDISRICQQLNGQQTCPECSTTTTDVPLVAGNSGHQAKCINCGYTTGANDNSWILQDIVIWDKTRALPYSSPGKLRNVFEYVLCFSKTAEVKFDLNDIRVSDPSQFKSWWVDYPERYHPRGKLPDNIWEFTTPAQGAFGHGNIDHPAPFPPAMVERILRLTTDPDDVVLDPFAGTGMVLAQADAMDRRPLGFELSAEYCEAYETIKEDVKDQWDNDGRSQSNIRNERQENLAEIITGLRQTKQAREVIREIADRQQLKSPSRLDAMLAIQLCESMDPLNDDRGTLADNHLLLIVEPGTPPQRAAQLEMLANESISQSPLSGYELNTTVQVATPADLLSTDDDTIPELHDQLFIYTDERHYEYTSKMTFDELLSNINELDEQSRLSEPAPPIVSNLGLEVHNPRRESDGKQSDSSQPAIHKLQRGPVDREKRSWIAMDGLSHSNAD